jgi:hemolysin D
MSWLSKLFRTGPTAAVDFLTDADEIERRPLPRLARMTLHFMLLAFVAFIAWASFSEVDLVVVARGRLVTHLPNIVVQPLETSIIQSIEVRPGQIVKKGERLAALDPTFSEADESQLRTRLGSLENQLKQLEIVLSGKVGPGTGGDADSRLQERLSGERQANYGAQVRRLDETIARTRAALETGRRDQEGLASRVKVLKEMESMQEGLVEQKYAVRSRLLDAKDRLLEAERGLQVAKNREQELRRELSGLEAEKSSFQTGWRQKALEDLLAVTRERDSVSEQLQKADKRFKLVVLTSPSDAVVLDIAKLSQGSVAKAAEPLFTLVPLGSDLEAEVQIDALDVGYVKVGDVTNLKLDAFPFQKHGTLKGELVRISEDAYRRETATAGLDAFYTGRIMLKEARIKNMSEKARLLPGMTTTAEIVVGKRSIMSYVLWPMIKAMDESIREP